jgi:hypothetical protein
MSTLSGTRDCFQRAFGRFPLQSGEESKHVLAFEFALNPRIAQICCRNGTSSDSKSGCRSSREGGSSDKQTN